MDVKVVIEVVVDVIVLVCGVRLGVAVGSGGSVSVADSGGARWKDCCSFPNKISEEL